MSSSRNYQKSHWSTTSPSTLVGYLLTPIYVFLEVSADSLGGSDINKAAKYILWRFTQTNRARLSVYPHLTQATDTSNVSLLPYLTHPMPPVSRVGTREWKNKSTC
jgi:hypothetical protein